MIRIRNCGVSDVMPNYKALFHLGDNVWKDFYGWTSKNQWEPSKTPVIPVRHADVFRPYLVFYTWEDLDGTYTVPVIAIMQVNPLQGHALYLIGPCGQFACDLESSDVLAEYREDAILETISLNHQIIIQ